MNVLKGASKLFKLSSVVSTGQVVAFAGYSKKLRSNATGKPNVFGMAFSQQWQFNVPILSEFEFGFALATLNS